MKKKILEIGPIVLAYGCVVVAIIGIIMDIVRADTADSTFLTHILLAVVWSIVSIKWSIDYRNKKKEDNT